VANHYLPRERTDALDEALFESPEPSWRPEDPDLPEERSRTGYRDPTGGGGEPRDARRWDSDEEYAGGYDGPHERPEAHGRSGPRVTGRLAANHRGRGAGHRGEDRLREQRGPERDRRPSAGSFEDRYHELGADAGIGSWPDRTGDPWRYASQSAYRGRDFEPERHELSAIHGQRTGYAAAPRGSGQRGPWRGPMRGTLLGDERIGEPAGSYRREAAEPTGTGREVHVHRGTGPHRGKGPAGYQRSDERIRELVCESLTDDDEIDASDVAVEVRGGEVTLSGAVDDRGAKRAAEDCAYSVSGVRDVQNQLRMRGDRAWSNPSGGAAVDLHETQSSAPGKNLGA